MAGRRPLELGVEDILKDLLAGEITIDQAKGKLASLNVKRISDLVRLDVRRSHRAGVPEAILAEGKTPEVVAKAAVAKARENGYALVTRVGQGHLKKLRSSLPPEFELDHNRAARAVVVRLRGHAFPKIGKVGVLAAGTADVPVAEEAAVTAEAMGCEVLKAYDVGVAGIHRLFEPLRRMVEEDVSAIVVVAGREGALPSVVAGLVDIPVIGVPTSVGYGAGGKGLSALLAMLQSCSPGLAVANIDNGFGGGAMAALIANRVARARDAIASNRSPQRKSSRRR